MSKGNPMSWGKTRQAAIQRGLERKGKRKIVAKHADSSKHSVWRSAGKIPDVKRIPSHWTYGCAGLGRFA